MSTRKAHFIEFRGSNNSLTFKAECHQSFEIEAIHGQFTGTEDLRLLVWVNDSQTEISCRSMAEARRLFKAFVYSMTGYAAALHRAAQ